MTKILIIGSKGFIGTHLYKYFTTNSEYMCKGCDIVADSTDDAYFQISAMHADFSILFKQFSFDYCINCSGAANVPFSLKNPLLDFELNTYLVVKILDAIRQFQPVCKFINLSSAAVYGNPDKLPIAESDKIQPISPYGLHKMQAEQICHSYYQHFGIGTASLRIFSAYGPGLKKQLLWDLYQKSQFRDVIELFGTGNETRDFIFIEDIVYAIDLIIKYAKFQHSIINIANGAQWKIKDIAKIFYQKLNWNGHIKFNGATRDGDPIHWEADITKLKQLGYKPAIDMNKGLEICAAWMLQQEK